MTALCVSSHPNSCSNVRGGSCVPEAGRVGSRKGIRSWDSGRAGLGCGVGRRRRRVNGRRYQCGYIEGSAGRFRKLQPEQRQVGESIADCKCLQIVRAARDILSYSMDIEPNSYEIHQGDLYNIVNNPSIDSGNK